MKFNLGYEMDMLKLLATILDGKLREKLQLTSLLAVKSIH